jgi:hypothetical protein
MYINISDSVGGARSLNFFVGFLRGFIETL